LVYGRIAMSHEEKQAASGSAGATASFGFRAVGAETKQGLVNEVFASVAARYDQMNDLMSGGLHRLWKDDFVAMLNPPKGPRSFAVLDVAGGTGDIAQRIVRAGGPGVTVTVADISPQMLAEGRRRAGQERLAGRIDFMVANAEALPFADRSFDAYTIAFGIRNVTHIDKVLAEAFRVLKPGGRFLCLEFSDVDVPGLAALYDLYSFTAIPAIGKVVTGDGAAYRYLVESIRTFPDAARFAAMIADAGFQRESHRALTGNVVAIHSGWRI
jgi:demethylmenaquinone methyltransferase/2-methoxy-6-polyprenyl-1,4-benzoquinol methylase